MLRKNKLLSKEKFNGWACSAIIRKSKIVILISKY